MAQNLLSNTIQCAFSTSWHFPTMLTMQQPQSSPVDLMMIAQKQEILFVKSIRFSDPHHLVKLFSFSILFASSCCSKKNTKQQMSLWREQCWRQRAYYCIGLCYGYSVRMPISGPGMVCCSWTIFEAEVFWNIKFCTLIVKNTKLMVLLFIRLCIYKWSRNQTYWWRFFKIVPTVERLQIM